MAIQAVQQDYKKAFQKHLHAYVNWNKTGSDLSKYLILIYCVECGLKYLLMREAKIHRTQDARPDLQENLKSHDFHRLLKQLKYAGTYSFPQIRTTHGDCVSPTTYHQLCRYSIPIIKEHQQYVHKYNTQLADIANWVREQV